MRWVIDTCVMAGLVPAIHVYLASQDVDARHNGPVLGPAKPDPSAAHAGVVNVNRCWSYTGSQLTMSAERSSL